ncbi:MAG: hypothetical protein ABIN74_14415, partial [Ferruginibacter sp.]
AIGSDAVNVNAPADNVAYNTSQCIYEIVYNNGPFEFVDYSKALDLQLLSDLDFYKFSYLNYINNFISTCINDTEEIAKIKNQLSTADTCRKFLPIKIWNITFQNLNLSDSQFTFKI